MTTPTQQSTPTPETQSQSQTPSQPKKEALAAFTATLHSVGTNLEAPLRDRAATITSNAVALEKQEKQLAESTAALARQNREWVGIADETREGLKEIGDVQNWAEMIERDLLALEEMMDGVERRDAADAREDEAHEGEEGRRDDGDGDGVGVGVGVDGGKNDAGRSERQRGWLRWW